ncbi:hypothetical protein IBTHAUMO2_240170 [Nitrosopumilaceae archaeon]|nr:hypothetical protein IBTHAUMO2_240170 [Nitrosopumilaceae archaeon]
MALPQAWAPARIRMSFPAPKPSYIPGRPPAGRLVNLPGRAAPPHGHGGEAAGVRDPAGGRDIPL